MTVLQRCGDTRHAVRGASSGRVVKKDGLDHARENLGHVDAHDLRDHLWEVDVRLQGLSLDEQIVGELVQLLHDLRTTGREERVRERERERRIMMIWVGIRFVLEKDKACRLKRILQMALRSAFEL